MYGCLIAAVGVLPAESATGQTARALLVGVSRYDLYRPRALQPSAREARLPARGLVPPLDAPTKDAQFFREYLTKRAGFAPPQVRLLLDGQATRRAILDSLTEISKRSAKGDVLFFFFAGHGSLRRNSQTPGKQLDQTLVPVDANAGVDDIRDKELAALLSDAALRGVQVTVIVDACNSGSITRGAASARNGVRFAAIDERDVNAPYTGPIPADVGVLTLSAAEDTQNAGEGLDQDGELHGYFTAALKQTLNSMPLTTPVRQLFAAARSRLLSAHPTQVPSMDANEARRRQPLLGGGSVAGELTIPLRQMGTRVVLDGGTAIGIRAGAELQEVVAGDSGPTVIRVVRSIDLATSAIEVVAGDPASLVPGALFRLTKWAPPDEAPLPVRIGVTLSEIELKTLISELKRLHSSTGSRAPSTVPVATSPVREPVDIEFLGQGWDVRSGERRTVVNGRVPTASALLTAIQQVGGEASTARINIPLSDVAAGRLREAIASRGVRVVGSTDNQSLYQLQGRESERGIEYRWQRTDGGRRRLASDDSMDVSPLPMHTGWTADPSTASLVATLEGQVASLSRIASWLAIVSPPADGRFPYRLVLLDERTNAPVGTDTVRQGARLALALEADSMAMQQTNRLERRFVYVLNVDAAGKGSLLYPAGNVNAENRLPYTPVARSPWPVRIPLYTGPGGAPSFNIAASTPGTEYLWLITSAQPLPEDAFIWAGVGSAAASRNGRLRGLAGLISRTGGQRRGGDERELMPTTWSITLRHLSVVR